MICVRILRELDEQKTLAQESIANLCLRSNISRQDKNLLTQLVNGVIRHQLSLDAIISCFSKLPLRKIEPWILYPLRIGLYQMVFLDKIPYHVAVHTSVELVKKLVRRANAAQFTNAILRTAARNIVNKSLNGTAIVNPQNVLHKKEDTWCEFKVPVFPHPDKDIISYISTNFSHPEWLISRWHNRFGKEKTIEICKANNNIPPLFLRINYNKITFKEFIELLNKKGVKSYTGNGALVVNNVAVYEIPGFTEGLFFVQDLTAMKVLKFLMVKPANSVLDMCAAPGGKTTHIAEILGNTGKVFALDISRKRLRHIHENCQRMGFNNIYLICGDASDNHAPFKVSFDRILIDAPCSNTGVLSRRVEVRWWLREEDIKTLASLQYSILNTGASLLKPEGILIYSTCSIEPEENHEVIKRFLQYNPDFYLEKEYCYLPTINKGDGGYMARIRKTPLHFRGDD